jgi:death on curing protein
MSTVYLDGLDEVNLLYSKTIDLSGGGLKGIIDTGSLESILHHIQNDDYYPEFTDKLTHLFFEVNKSHCFQDGNKRIAITLGSMFLLKNGYLSVVKEFLFKMETISYHVAAGRISKPLLNEIITSIIHEEDYSEELKLKLLNSIQK